MRFSPGRRTAFHCTLFAVLVASLTVVTASAPTVRQDSCQALRSWAGRYQGATPKLAHLSAYDRHHRLAIFAVLSPETRADLWRGPREGAARDTTWTAEQRALLREGITLVVAERYANKGERSAAAAGLRSRIDRVWPESRRQIWFELGPRTGYSPVPYCDCNRAENGCWGGLRCTGHPCDGYSPGCGFLGQTSCDGLCG